jgi:hypothetical protein
MGDINTGTWPLKLGVGRKADDFVPQKIIVAKYKEVKTEWSNSDNSDKSVRIFHGRVWLKKGCFAKDDDDDDDGGNIKIF